MDRFDPLRLASDTLINAVRAGDGTQVARGVTFYEELMAAFVEEVRKYGVVFDEKIVSDDVFGWRTFNDISDQIRRFLDASIESERLDFIREGERLAVRLAVYGIQRREFLTFKTAVELLTSIYWRTADRAAPIRDHGRETVRQLIKDIVKLHLEPALLSTPLQDREALSSFVKVVMMAYQSLLIFAIEKRDAGCFAPVLDDLDQLFRRSSLHQDEAEHHILSDGTNRYTLDDLRSLVKIGAGLRLIVEFETKTDRSLEGLLREVLARLPGTEPLTELVLKALAGDVGSQLGWDYWDLVPDQVVWVRTQDRLAMLYVFGALRFPLPARLPHGERSEQLLQAATSLLSEPAPPSKELLFDVLRSLPKATQPTTTDASTSSPPPSARDDEPADLAARLADIERLLRDAAEAQKADEKSQRLSAPRSERRVAELETEIRSDEESRDGLRKAFELAGRIEQVKDCPRRATVADSGVDRSRSVHRDAGVDESRRTRARNGAHLRTPTRLQTGPFYCREDRPDRSGTRVGRRVDGDRPPCCGISEPHRSSVRRALRWRLEPLSHV